MVDGNPCGSLASIHIAPPESLEVHAPAGFRARVWIFV